MDKTYHFGLRRNQRGISQAMVELVLEYGKCHQDKAILGRKDAAELLAKMQQDMRILKKILDKGGVVVVASDNALVTTYNYKQSGGCK